MNKSILSLLPSLLLTITVLLTPTPVYASTCQPLNILYPLYSYPPAIWTTIASAGLRNRLVAIVNPNNGPGAVGSPDTNYIIGMNILKNASIPMIGYVSTSYGNRNPVLIRSDINKWSTDFSNWVTGIFFDEVSNTPTFYSDLSAYATSKNLGALVAINPGNEVGLSLTGISNIQVTFEGSFSSWQNTQTRGNLTSSAIIYQAVNQVQMREAVQLASNRGYGYVFVTNDSLPNPFDTLPAYWTDFISQIANPCSTPNPTIPTGNPLPITPPGNPGSDCSCRCYRGYPGDNYACCSGNKCQSADCLSCVDCGSWPHTGYTTNCAQITSPPQATLTPTPPKPTSTVTITPTHPTATATPTPTPTQTTPPPPTATHNPTITPTPPTCPLAAKGNLNCDSQGLISEIDLGLLLSAWSPTQPIATKKPDNPTPDLTGDGFVSETDLSILLTNWQTS